MYFKIQICRVDNLNLAVQYEPKIVQLQSYRFNRLLILKRGNFENWLIKNSLAATLPRWGSTLVEPDMGVSSVSHGL